MFKGHPLQRRAHPHRPKTRARRQGAPESEIKARGITSESAAVWLSHYRGCVDSELYEFAVHSLPCDTPVAGLLARRSLPGGTGADR